MCQQNIRHHILHIWIHPLLRPPVLPAAAADTTPLFLAYHTTPPLPAACCRRIFGIIRIVLQSTLQDSKVLCINSDSFWKCSLDLSV